MKKKFLAVTAIMALAMGMVAGCGSQSTSSQGSSGDNGSTIKIGADLELTGGQASYGTSALKGIQLAAEEINNAGGINGKKIEIVQADDSSKPEESTRAAQKLISQDKVVAIIGTSTSTNTLAAVQVVQDKKIPMITPTATNAKVTVNNGKVNSYVFRACFIDPFQGSVMANFATQNLKAKTAVVYIDTSSDYSKGLAKSFEDTFKKNGGQILSEESYQQNDSDFKVVLTRIKERNPDVIYVPGYYNEVGKIVKQAREMGIKAPFMGGDGWDAPQLVDIAGKENLNNTFISNHYAADDPDPVIQKFVSAFKTKYGSAPDGFAVLGYDAMNMLADAIKRAGSADPSKIRDALEATKDFKAVTGTLTLDQNHDPIKAATILEFKDGKEVFKTKVNPQ
ncbi:ethanolamine utilization protein EutJ [Collibacillus ludicampi]|uniref:Ethanolamine utilization protein EutJ n=2 Tax=Collibacillus ludicampi TaxID=2771369 RepID=A0AAV4LAW9_9BACL|nr:ABC transporter substrate-binding protein [Collibacillus ludicampi]GIM44896.1 ethanolamine utilization protein EutJ [Collibacillus ludicampi]